MVQDARIVGGYPAQPGEFPHQVAIFYNDGFICGGSIITFFSVLTAAHCVFSSRFPHKSHFKVIAGLQNITDEGKNEQIRNVEIIKIHEGYNRQTFENDIAIMHLSEPFSFNKFVRNIGFPVKDENFDGYATVSGWGTTEEGGYGSVGLRKVKVPIFSSDVCRIRYQGTYGITDDMLCMGDRGGDSCEGDSGGAAICKRNDSTVVQCGIVSFGRGCAQDDFPGVYTLVAHYTDWIAIQIFLGKIMDEVMTMNSEMQQMKAKISKLEEQRRSQGKVMDSLCYQNLTGRDLIDVAES